MENIKDRELLNRIIIAILALLAIVSIIQGCRNAIQDSQDFQWDAAKALTMGINPYDESLNPSGILDNYDFEKYYLQMEANQFPSLLMILYPFTLLPPLAARYTWLCFNMIFTVAIIWLLRKTFLRDIKKDEFIIVTLLMLAGTPYRNQVGVGQHTLFAFCFFLLAVYFSEYREKRSSLVTIIALFICYFKYTLTVPLVLYFVYKKRWKELIISVIPHVILTGVAARILNNSFLDMIIKPLKVSSALSAEGGLDISAVLGGSVIAYVLLVLIMVSLFVMALKLPEGFDASFMAVLVLFSVIVVYHRTYDFFVIITAIAAFKELSDKAMFDKAVEDNKNNVQALDALKKDFYVTLLAVFFFLRIFSENTFSKLIAGTLYYTFILSLTALVVYVGFSKSKDV